MEKYRKRGILRITYDCMANLLRLPVEIDISHVYGTFEHFDKRFFLVGVKGASLPKVYEGEESPVINLSQCMTGDTRDEVTKKFEEFLGKGWVIWPTSCMCGGKYAWLEPTGHGSYKMYGCICHNIPEERNRQ